MTPTPSAAKRIAYEVAADLCYVSTGEPARVIIEGALENPANITALATEAGWVKRGDIAGPVSLAKHRSDCSTMYAAPERWMLEGEYAICSCGEAQEWFRDRHAKEEPLHG